MTWSHLKIAWTNIKDNTGQRKDSMGQTTKYPMVKDKPKCHESHSRPLKSFCATQTTIRLYEK